MVAAASGQTIFDATTAEVVPAEIHLWSNGAKSLSLVNAGDAAFSRVADTRPEGRIPVLRIRSEGSAAALVIGRECPIDATVLEFTYFLPSNAPVRSINAGMRVKVIKTHHELHHGILFRCNQCREVARLRIRSCCCIG